ncbi:hypothetical protein SAMN05421858_1461 [Haladaptatus litoreus]|uniref:Uncharacterized protein n=1 Tax=Haladaptatus litoreus TaxID=553468 RepID=A0A1N6Y8X9_9EURY|nr:hypothetical protein [Haladaptatus litoreus]SIR11038.1 hypothetical protein SAMN05421858_1461 [Haladaptatus litoreus]
MPLGEILLLLGVVVLIVVLGGLVAIFIAMFLFIATVGALTIAALTIPILLFTPAPRTFWLAVTGRLWRYSAGITERRFLIPYSVVLFAVSLGCLFLIPGVGGVLTAVGIARFRWLAFLSFGVVAIVSGSFFISRTSSVPGGPTSTRSVLGWVVFATAYCCLLAGIGFLL